MRRAIAMTALAVGSVVLVAPHASANLGDGSADQSGYSVRAVSVTIKSDSNTVVSSGTTSISVAPSCYWQLYNPTVDGTDATTPEGFQKFYDQSLPYLTGHAAAGRLAMPGGDEVARVTEAAKSGAKYRWYNLQCRKGVNGVEAGYTKSGGEYLGEIVPVSWAAFIEGQQPEPYVAPEDLARAVWDYARGNLVAPEIDRNPKVAANGGATVVNLATWFWVTNVAQSLADDGKLNLSATAGNTTVTLQATSTPLAITSTAGSTECSIEQAKSRKGACKIVFERSNASLAVTASLTWTASWSGGGETAVLPSVSHSTTENIPVLEIQVPNR